MLKEFSVHRRSSTSDEGERAPKTDEFGRGLSTAQICAAMGIDPKAVGDLVLSRVKPFSLP